MPMRSEHSARLKSPDGFEKFRRQNNKGGPGVDFIFGITADGKTEIQAVRFDKKRFTPEAAREWLKKHDMSAIEFETAKKGTMVENRAAVFTYEHVTTNANCGKLRYEELDGRRYLVAPMVMLTEGVHQGSKGPLYYPPEELSKTPVVWNTKPIVVYHPKIDGCGVSACSPDILAERSVGMVMHTHYADGKLKAEAWLDDSKIDRVDSRIRDYLNKNQVMEISTGLFTDNVAQQGEWRGERYTHVARNYRPDHLALLPDERGACSVADGAGLLRNAANYDDVDDEGVESTMPHGKDPRKKSRKRRAYPIANTDEGLDAQFKLMLDEAVFDLQAGQTPRDVLEGLLGNAFRSHKARRWYFANLAADKATGGGGGKGGGGKVMSSGDAKVGQWVNTPKGGRAVVDHVYDDNKTENGRLVQVDLGKKKANYRETELKLSGDQDSKFVGDKKVPDLAGKHISSLPKDPKRLSIPKAVEALDQMGYKLGKATTDLKTKKTSYKVTGPDGKTKTMTTDEIKDLVYKGQATTNARKSSKSHNQMRMLLSKKVSERYGPSNSIEDVYDDFVVYYNPATEKRYRVGYEHTAQGCRLSDEAPQEVMVVVEYQTVTGDYVANISPPSVGDSVMKKDDFVNQLIANEATGWEEDDREFLGGLTDQQLGKLYVANIDATIPDPEEEDEEEDDDDAVENVTPPPALKPTKVQAPPPPAKAPASVVAKAATPEEYIANAPAGMREVLQAGLDAYNQTRTGLVEAIVANESNKFNREYLETLSTDVLQGIVALAGGQPQPVAAGHYIGANGPAPLMTANSAKIPESEMLPHPQMDFSTAGA